METYIYTENVLAPKPHRCNTCLEIYILIDDKPRWAGKTFFHTASSPGEDSEVFQWLIKEGRIPKELYDLSSNNWRGAGYYRDEVIKRGYQIFGI